MKHLSILLIFFVFIISSCTKDNLSKNASCGNNENVKVPLKVNEALVYHKPTTPEELQLVENLKKVTTVFMELYKNQENLKVVNASIFAKVYTDESVLLRDLIYPESGIVSTNERFINLAKKANVNLSSFSKNFWDEVKKLGDLSFNAFLQSIKPDDYETNGLKNKLKRAYALSLKDISIYFPYHENFAPRILKSDPNEWGENPDGSTYLITSIVTATADADQGIGYAQYYDANGMLNYTQVVVDDDYCELNPTQIIGLNGIEPSDFYENLKATEYFPPQDSINIPNYNPGRVIKSVYIGDVKCTHMFDALFSITLNGGGSEIRFTRSDGYLKMVDGQVTADNFYVNGHHDIDRPSIRYKRWQEWSALWDMDWEKDNKEQIIAIYEEDNRNSVTITGTVKTTVKFDSTRTGEGSVAVSLTYKSEDEIIKQQNYKFSSFFGLNRIDMEGEIHNEWPVYDKGGSVSFTLWDKGIY